MESITAAKRFIIGAECSLSLVSAIGSKLSMTSLYREKLGDRQANIPRILQVDAGEWRGYT